MLIVLPGLILLAASLAIFLIRWLWPKFKYPWSLAVIAALISWVGMALLRFRLGTAFNLPGWQLVNDPSGSFSLVLDDASWPYALAITGVVLAVILTATARAQYQTNPMAWAGSLLLGGLGLFGVLAANPLTLIISWGAIDLVELVLLLSNVSTKELSQRSVLGFAARTGGILFGIWAFIASRASGDSFDLRSIPTQVSLFILIAAALRLGVLPLHLPFSTEPRMRRGVGTLLRLAPAASALVVLGRLPDGVISTGQLPLMLCLAAFAALYAAMMWVKAAGELSGRPYWIISLAALAVICVLRGDPVGSRAWGVSALLSGGILFLYSARERQLGLVWLLGLWGISGLPYSPTVNGWNGLWVGPLPGLNIFLVLTVALLMVGYTLHANREGDSLFGMERWIQTLYPMGLILLPTTHVMLTFSDWLQRNDIGIWWLGGVLSTLVAVGILWLSRKPDLALDKRLSLPLSALTEPWLDRALDGITRFFSLEWLYRFIWSIFRLVNQGVTVISRILEGDGGVLWAFVLLTLIISLIRVGGRP